MPSQAEIIAAIERQVTTYSLWYIGITDNPDRRKQEHNDPKHWHHWDANTEIAARTIEKIFIDKGMRGDVGGGINPTYVYIY